MLPHEKVSIIAAVALATILTPVVWALLSRGSLSNVPARGRKHRVRNQVIEILGVVFFMAGSYIPFLLAGTTQLKPTAVNGALILSFGVLFMLGGMAMVAHLFGDRGARNFLDFCESERGLNRKGIVVISKLLAIIAVGTLITILLLGG